MKKILSSVLLLSFAFSASAQIVINLADIAAIGTVYALGVDTLVGPSIIAGPTGSGQSWNLTAATASYIDSVKIVSPASTAYSGNFPSATFCSERFSFGDTSFFYISANAQNMKAVGIVLDPLQTGNKFIISPTPASKIMTFPYQMGSTYRDTSYGEVRGSGADIGQSAIDSFRYKSLSIRDVAVDGSGNLTISNGTFSVLREKEISRSIDSIWAKFPIFGWSLFQDTDVTDSVYRWISDSLGLNIAELSFDTLGNESQLQYYNPTAPVVARIQSLNPTLSFYPNPASGQFTIDNSVTGNSTLVIRDASGKTISETQISSGKNEIETISMGTGIYFLEMRSDQTNAIMTGKLVVQK